MADDEQKSEQSNGDESKKSGVIVDRGATFGPPRKRKLLTWLTVIIIILIMIFAGLLGWLWRRDRDDSAPTGTGGEPVVEAPADEEPEEEVCADDFTIYTNTDFGVEFCYPTAWGAPTVSDAKFAPADTGQRWLVSFASNSAVHAGLVTEDWETAVARDGTCTDPAVKTMPIPESFSTEWTVEAAEGDGTVSSALRGVQNSGTSLLINEYVDNLLTNGVCLNGYKSITNDLYPVVAASYFVAFSGTVTTPQQHIDSPEILIPAAERTNFATFVESIQAVEE